MNLSIMLDAAGQSQWSGILMMVVIVAIFYFFMIRPQQKRQKEIQKAREALKVGDKVKLVATVFPVDAMERSFNFFLFCPAFFRLLDFAKPAE